MSIDKLSPTPYASLSPSTLSPGHELKSKRGTSFQDVFSGFLNEVNTLQHQADSQVQKLASGEVENLHDVTITMDEAKKSFELMLEVRNKLLEAFEKLQRN